MIYPKEVLPPGEFKARIDLAVHLRALGLKIPPQPGEDPGNFSPTDKQYREAARDIHHIQGDVEIYPGATINRTITNSTKPGAFVAAWVWVSEEDARE